MFSSTNRHQHRTPRTRARGTPAPVVASSSSSLSYQQPDAHDISVSALAQRLTYSPTPAKPSSSVSRINNNNAAAKRSKKQPQPRPEQHILQESEYHRLIEWCQYPSEVKDVVEASEMHDGRIVDDGWIILALPVDQLLFIWHANFTNTSTAAAYDDVVYRFSRIVEAGEADAQTPVSSRVQLVRRTDSGPLTQGQLPPVLYAAYNGRLALSWRAGSSMTTDRSESQLVLTRSTDGVDEEVTSMTFVCTKYRSSIYVLGTSFGGMYALSVIEDGSAFHIEHRPITHMRDAAASLSQSHAAAAAAAAKSSWSGLLTGIFGGGGGGGGGATNSGTAAAQNLYGLRAVLPLPSSMTHPLTVVFVLTANGLVMVEMEGDGLRKVTRTMEWDLAAATTLMTKHFRVHDFEFLSLAFCPVRDRLVVVIRAESMVDNQRTHLYFAVILSLSWERGVFAGLNIEDSQVLTRVPVPSMRAVDSIGHNSNTVRTYVLSEQQQQLSASLNPLSLVAVVRSDVNANTLALSMENVQFYSQPLQPGTVCGSSQVNKKIILLTKSAALLVTSKITGAAGAGAQVPQPSPSPSPPRRQQQQPEQKQGTPPQLDDMSRVDSASLLQTAVFAYFRSELMQAQTALAALCSRQEDMSEIIAALAQRLVDARPFSGKQQQQSERRQSEWTSASASALNQLKEKRAKFDAFLTFLSATVMPHYDDGHDGVERSVWSTVSLTARHQILELGEKIDAAVHLLAYFNDNDSRTRDYITERQTLVLAGMQSVVRQRGDETLVNDGLSVQDVFFSRVSRLQDLLVVLVQHADNAARDKPVTVAIVSAVLETVFTWACRHRERHAHLLRSDDALRRFVTQLPLHSWILALRTTILTHAATTVHALVNDSPSVTAAASSATAAMVSLDTITYLRQCLRRLADEFLLPEYLDVREMIEPVASLLSREQATEWNTMWQAFETDRHTFLTHLHALYQQHRGDGAGDDDRDGGNSARQLLWETAFAFAVSFEHFEGVIQLCEDLPPAQLVERIIAMLSRWGHRFATVLFTVYDRNNVSARLVDSIPHVLRTHNAALLDRVSRWIGHGGGGELLSLTQYNEWLEQHWKDKPEWAWKHHVFTGEYVKGAEAALAAGELEHNVLKRRNLLSLCKMNLLVSGYSVDTPAVRRVDDLLQLLEIQARLVHHQLGVNDEVLEIHALYDALLDFKPEPVVKRNHANVWDKTMQAAGDDNYWALLGAVYVLETHLRPLESMELSGHQRQRIEALWHAAIGKSNWNDYRGVVDRAIGNEWVAQVETTPVFALVQGLGVSGFYDREIAYRATFENAVASLSDATLKSILLKTWDAALTSLASTNNNNNNSNK